jgi:hypothetical protein
MFNILFLHFPPLGRTCGAMLAAMRSSPARLLPMLFSRWQGLIHWVQAALGSSIPLATLIRLHNPLALAWIPSPSAPARRWPAHH